MSLASVVSSSHIDEAQDRLSSSVFYNDCNDFIGEHHDRLALLRRKLHAHPELANKESNTTKTIVTFLKSLANPPDIVQDIGGGFIALFDFNTTKTDGSKTVVFRCELDAPQVVEKNDFQYKSTNHGISHKCGHDGHMAIVAGLALLLSDFYTPSSGRVVLLFQPAEETGEGARQMVDARNPILRSILDSPHSSIFALHNVPGFPTSSVVLPRGSSFASASKGLHVKLVGATSHASQPHLGRNPTLAMCNIITGLIGLPSLNIPYDQKALVTIVGARAGSGDMLSFGVSAGEVEIMATLRATSDTVLNTLVRKATKLVSGISATYELVSSIEYQDTFSATINDAGTVEMVETLSKECGLDVVWMDEAFPWSEDFGVFLQRTKGAIFGLGIGKTHEPLHGEYYDFPDSEIRNGVTMFASIVRRVLDEQA